MITIICLLGKSGCGKSTLQTELSKYGLNKIVTYTTRPPRPNEENGKDYYFINTPLFFSLKDEDFFVEWSSYDTINGKWYYATALQDVTNVKETSVWIANPEGLRNLRHKTNINPITFYINVDDTTLIDRLNHRGDKKIEMFRRFFTDTGLFMGIENEVDYVIENNSDIKNGVTHIKNILIEKGVIK